MTGLLVVLGAALGAPLRYLTDRAMRVRFGATSPWGTFAVNVVGSALLGLLVGAAAPPALLALAGTGFCGALTTYSTFGAETIALAEDRRWAAAVANVVGSVLACLAAAGLGSAAGAAVLG
ncbi:fluoride efflux transporter CrcB [Pseudonocardia sp. MH-G8]|uniref:fluoride efflux transporter CrcB n=1 Tax=Pseudonocardia sp. MH-G8 TaxID=1854588 RepID=UPI000BA04F65|nr:fluoride efflux transporter CrcB [Pseudonocardia sp. MH-G8]OZM84415.1 chromosome condensation protein CrcB [Pseudonocardia sp. MH-G8]